VRRYHLNVTDRGITLAPDDGIELEDDEEAREEAIEASGEMIRDLDSDFQPGAE
jgi:hypothetical protein